MAENLFSKVWEDKTVLPNGEVVNPAVKPRNKGEQGVAVTPQNIGGGVPQLNGQAVVPQVAQNGMPQGQTIPQSGNMPNGNKNMGTRINQVSGQAQGAAIPVQEVNPYFQGGNMTVDASLPSNLWAEQQNRLLALGDKGGADAVGYGLTDRAFGGVAPDGVRRDYAQRLGVSPETLGKDVLESKTKVGVGTIGKPYVQTDSDATKSVFDYLNKGNEEERYSKQNESLKRMLLLTDALRHLGNLVNVSNGATNQVFTSPVVAQEQRYQTEKAKRDANRVTAQKQALDRYKWDAEQKRKDAEAAMKERDFKYKVAKDAADMERDLNNDAFNQAFKVGQQKSLEEHRKSQLALGKQRNAIAARNARTASASLEYRKKKDAADAFKDMKVMRHPEEGANYYISKEKFSDPKYMGIVRKYYDEFVKDGLVKPIQTSGGIVINFGSGNFSGGDGNNKMNPSMREMLEWMGNPDKSTAINTQRYQQMMRELEAVDTGSGNYSAYVFGGDTAVGEYGKKNGLPLTGSWKK